MGVLFFVKQPNRCVFPTLHYWRFRYALCRLKKIPMITAARKAKEMFLYFQKIYAIAWFKIATKILYKDNEKQNTLDSPQLTYVTRITRRPSHSGQSSPDSCMPVYLIDACVIFVLNVINAIISTHALLSQVKIYGPWRKAPKKLGGINSLTTHKILW